MLGNSRIHLLHACGPIYKLHEEAKCKCTEASHRREKEQVGTASLKDHMGIMEKKMKTTSLGGCRVYTEGL